MLTKMVEIGYSRGAMVADCESTGFSMRLIELMVAVSKPIKPISAIIVSNSIGLNENLLNLNTIYVDQDKFKIVKNHFVDVLGGALPFFFRDSIDPKHQDCTNLVIGLAAPENNWDNLEFNDVLLGAY